MNTQATTEKTIKKFSIKTWKKILPYLRPYFKRLAALFFVLVIFAAVDVAFPLLLSFAINKFISGNTLDGLAGYIAIYFGLLVIQTIGVIAMGRLCMGTEMRLGRDLKRAEFVQLQKLGFSYYNQHAVGWILSRVMNDSNRIAATFAWWMVDLVWGCLYIVAVVVTMLILNLQLGLIVSLVIPITILATALMQSKFLDAHRKEREINSQIVASFNEGITGAKTSKTLVIEDKNIADFSQVTGTMRSAALRTNRLSATLIPIVTTLSSVAVAFVLARGGQLELANILQPGTLSAFISYALLMLHPVQQVVQAVVEFIGSQVSIERVDSLLNAEYDINDTIKVLERDGDVLNPKPENWPRIKGDIEFKNVWFKYPDGEEYVLEDFSLKIPAGTTVAIVGETGAGKSTLINLACRFYEPTKGQVLIDGQDARELGQIRLHSQLGYVLQNPHLFSGTIKDNIRYGKLSATDEDVFNAARLVSADTVAAKFDDGYNTDVGEGGDKLSTGEKQLVSFARAMLADPPIFVLDEATSSIDTETEQLIQDSISHILDGRTSFLVAHRLSTIKHADLILVVQGGKIIEQGTHKSLMSQKGYYHKLYTAMHIDQAKI